MPNRPPRRRDRSGRPGGARGHRPILRPALDRQQAIIAEVKGATRVTGAGPSQAEAEGEQTQAQLDEARAERRATVAEAYRSKGLPVPEGLLEAKPKA